MDMMETAEFYSFVAFITDSQNSSLATLSG